jgi:hypothetical protein
MLGDMHPTLGSNCWCWTGRINRNGYGRARWEGRDPVVHRTVWTILRGLIPDGLILDHLCKVRNCVNPLHLQPVTHQENTLRGDAILFKPNVSLQQ